MERPSREEIDEDIASSLAPFEPEVRAVWQRIRIEPELWRSVEQPRFRFWAIAIDGDQVIWLDHVEGGYTRSAFAERGTIDTHWTDQKELAEILHAIARELAEARRHELVEGDLPPELAGPGRIVNRWSTYWVLHGDAGAEYRVHFRDDVEVSLDTPTYATAELAPAHPLLLDYAEPTSDLYFSGARSEPDAIDLDALVREQTAGWRSLSRYLGPALGTHGLYMRAPTSICRAVAAALEAGGVSTSVLPGRPARTGYVALVLGRSYVIARGFAFERRA